MTTVAWLRDTGMKKFPMTFPGAAFNLMLIIKVSLPSTSVSRVVGMENGNVGRAASAKAKKPPEARSTELS